MECRRQRRPYALQVRQADCPTGRFQTSKRRHTLAWRLDGAYVLKSQYGHFVSQNGMWTYRDIGSADNMARRLHIEEDMHNVTVLHDVVLALLTQHAVLTRL